MVLERAAALPWRRLAWWSLVVWIVLFWRRGYPSLLDPDEAHYAELTREMLRAGNWLVPLLDGSPYIDKPILFHWLQGASVLVFGFTEFALRLPSALGALALIATTRWLGARLFSVSIGEWSALMLATVPATFALASIGMMDMVYTAFLFGGVACLIVSGLRDRPRLQYPGYVLIALAMLTKGPVAVVLLGLLLLASLAAGAELRRAALRLRWFAGALIILALATPWFAWMWATFGRQFVDGYVLAGNLWYFTEPVEFSTRTTSYTFYLRIFATALFPWSIVVIGRLLDLALTRKRDPMGPEARILWLWMLVVIGFFTAARFKLDHYIFPAAPACCLLAARAWALAAEDRRLRWTRWAVGAIATVLVAAGAVLSFALFRIDAGVGGWAIALPVALAAGGVLLVFELRRRGGGLPASAAVLVGTLIAVYATVVTAGFPVLEQSRPTAPLGRWIAEHSPSNAVVGSYGLEDWQASIRFYADRRVERLETLDGVREFFARQPGGYVLMRGRDYRALRESGLGVREVGELPAIVGRTGKYLRRQVWGRILVVTLTGRTMPPLASPTT
jgi:4-amino-4-deoxy-L-arabinose transferase-like glycosyltransferase